MVRPEGSEPADPGERFDIDTEQFAAATGDSATTTPPTIPPVVDEAALPLLESAPLRDDALDELLAFYVYGARPEDLSTTDTPTPALLHGFGDLTRVRHDYPLCLTREGGVVLPLTTVVDGVVEKIGAEGDEAERVRRHLYRLESQMRSMLNGSESVPLDQLWGGATARVLEESDDASLGDNLSAARAALSQEADVVGLGGDTAREMFVSIATREWHKRSGEFGTELVSILRGLEDILRVDDSHTPEANSPDHLRSASGKGEDDEVDFLAMSSLLGSSHLGDPLPAERRERIRSAINMIRLASPLFEAKDLEDNPPIGVTRISTDTAAAHAGYESRMQLMANFFRAIRIARIEIANGYRPDVHDPFFENFDATYLTEDEWTLCPPVLVILDPVEYDGKLVDTIVGLVARGAPFKVLVPFEDLLPHDEVGAVPALMTGPQARLASMLMALGHVHVLQCSASQVEVLADGMAAGYAYAGPSVVSVFTGGSHTTLPRFLSASAAAESRAFPSFEFHPGRGDTWAQRMDMRTNTEPEAAWPMGKFTWHTAEGEESTAELPFTTGDFLLGDSRLASHFLSVGPDRWHENLVPLHEYVNLDPAITDRMVPYVTGVDGEGRVRRVAVSHAVVDAVTSGAAFWRSLQELGGIDNSHALALIDSERARLEEAKDKAVAELEVKYSADLEQNIGDLTREIVHRIASQLLSGQSIGDIAAAAPMAPRAAAPAAPAPATEAPAEEAPAEDEDDVIALDDPYIDTPLCTSCNDCFKINDRLFAYNENKQAYIADADAGTFKDLVSAAEICPVKIIHPGKPRNPSEEGLEELQKRAQPFL